jgi:CDP-glycerol glycerophosphotransferase
MAQIDSQKIDLILSGCGFSTNIFRNSFWYSGEVLECGTPRVDMFFKDPSLVKRKVFEYYGIDLKSKLVVYAPTFRDNKKADTHGLNQELLLKTLEIKTAEKWVLGIRMHPNIPDDICACNEKIIPMSKYPDMQELIVACDLLITDYSSCMFDAAIAKRACILFAPDLEKYLRDERGLYFAFRELPFLVAMNNEELSKVIMDFSRTTYEKKVDDFLESIESYEEGDASKKVVEYMMEIIGKE